MTALTADDTRARSERYSAVAIALHWVLALALAAMIALGWNMHDNEGRPIEWMFQLHKSLGITILVLTIARLGWRLLNPPPPLPDDMKPLEKTASHLVHVGFYALMVLMPLSGWVLVSASPFSVSTVLYGSISWPHLPFLPDLAVETRRAMAPVIEFVHSKFAWVLIGLVALHVAGAMKHEFGSEEGVLKRMVPGFLNEARPPSRPAQGAGIAFGAAAGFFLLVAAVPMIAQAGQSGSSSGSAPATATGWVVDPEGSEIGFSGEHEGRPFAGTFRDWSASITFDPEALGASEVSVTIAPASVDTGQTLYNDTLKASEWFGVSRFPSATVTLANFDETETGYTADATITIKETTATVPFAFELSIEGDSADMTGRATLSRTELNLGQSSDPGADYVSEEIEVTVTVKASRAAG